MIAVPLRKTVAYSGYKAVVTIVLKHWYICTMLATDLGTTSIHVSIAEGIVQNDTSRNQTHNNLTRKDNRTT